MDKWRREGEEWERHCKAAKAAKQQAPTNAAMQVRDEFVERIMAERQFVFDVITGVVGQLKGDLLQEIAKQVGELRAEVNVAQAIDRDKVVDLPNFLRKAS
jgi:hypothetical protein